MADYPPEVAPSFLRIPLPDPETVKLIRAYARHHRVFIDTAVDALITLGAHMWLRRRRGGLTRASQETPEECHARMARVRAAKLDRTTAPRNDEPTPPQPETATPPPNVAPERRRRGRPRLPARTAGLDWPHPPE